MVIYPKYSSKLFRKTVEDALSKKAPFDKTEYGEKSDSGFKDYMIWRTICEYDFSDFSTIYFFSCDKIFEDNKEQLIKEFNENNPSTKIIIVKYESNDKDKRAKSLEYVVEQEKMPKTDTIKLYNYDLILEQIIKIKYKEEQENYYFNNDNVKVTLNDIEWSKFSKEDISITDVKFDEKTEVYEVIILFTTFKYTFNSTAQIDVEKELEGKISLFYKKEGKSFRHIKNKVYDICFKNSFSNIDEIINIYNNFWHHNLYNAFSKLSCAFNTDNMEKLRNNLSAIYFYLESLEKVNEEKNKTYQIFNKKIDNNRK